MSSVDSSLIWLYLSASSLSTKWHGTEDSLQYNEYLRSSHVSQRPWATKLSAMTSEPAFDAFSSASSHLRAFFYFLAAATFFRSPICSIWLG